MNITVGSCCIGAFCGMSAPLDLKVYMGTDVNSSFQLMCGGGGSSDLDVARQKSFNVLNLHFAKIDGNGGASDLNHEDRRGPPLILICDLKSVSAL